jgi:predicted transcriptional regulator
MCMENRHKFYNARKKEVIPPSVLFRMLKGKKDNELEGALKKCVVKVIPHSLMKEEEEKYFDLQLDALGEEINFINKYKKGKTNLINRYYDSLKNKIKKLQETNKDPVFQLKLREIKGRI